MPSGATQSVLHKALVKDVAKYIRGLDGYPYKIFGGAFGQKGMPDFLCAIPIKRFPSLPAVAVAVECKTGGAVLSTAQKEVRAVLEASRVLYLVVQSDVQLEEALFAARLITARTLQRPLIPEAM